MVEPIKKVELQKQYNKLTLQEQKMNPNFLPPTPAEAEEYISNIFNIKEFINDEEGLAKSLEDLGIDGKYADRAQKIDENHISIEFDNGVNCTYEVSPDGSMKVISAYAKNENGDLVYEYFNGLATHYNTDGTIKYTEKFNENNEVIRKNEYENGFQSKRTDYTYDDGKLVETLEVDLINKKIISTEYSGNKGEEYKTKVIEKDENGIEIISKDYDWENSQIKVTNLETNEYEIHYFKDNNPEKEIGISYYDNEGNFIKFENDITKALDLAENQLNESGAYYWNYVQGNNTYSSAGSTPWCACFVSWIMNTSGLDNFKSADSTQWINHYKDIETWHDSGSGYTPKPGDVILFDWEGGGPNGGGEDHIGIVTKVENGEVHTIEGNMNYDYVLNQSLSNGVHQGIYDINSTSIMGYGTPPNY